MMSPIKFINKNSIITSNNTVSLEDTSPAKQVRKNFSYETKKNKTIKQKFIKENSLKKHNNNIEFANILLYTIKNSSENPLQKQQNTINNLSSLQKKIQTIPTCSILSNDMFTNKLIKKNNTNNNLDIIKKNNFNLIKNSFLLYKQPNNKSHVLLINQQADQSISCVRFKNQLPIWQTKYLVQNKSLDTQQIKKPTINFYHSNNLLVKNNYHFIKNNHHINKIIRNNIFNNIYKNTEKESPSSPVDKKNNTSLRATPEHMTVHKRNISHIIHQTNTEKESPSSPVDKKNNTSLRATPEHMTVHKRNISHIIHQTNTEKESPSSPVDKKNNTSLRATPEHIVKEYTLEKNTQKNYANNVLFFSHNLTKENISSLNKQHVLSSPAEQIKNFIQDNYQKLMNVKSHSFSITLKPEILGTVHLNIKITHNHISAIITAEHQKTLENLQQNISLLTGSLQKTGFHVYHENIQFNLDQGSQQNHNNHNHQEPHKHHQEKQQTRYYHNDTEFKGNSEIQDISIIKERLLSYTRVGSTVYK